MRPIRVAVVLASFAAVVLAIPAETAPAVANQREVVDAIRLVPSGDGRVLFRRGRYDGALTITARSGGLGLVELQTINGYLSGIREVPFSWPDEALQVQAVAARTYLAWTLQRGRSSAGRTYGFDICASTQCQVYRGVGVVEGSDGDRWLAALDDTIRKILTHDGRPAQALYSASHGSQSRGVEEIWGGTALPYLVRVSSPEAGVSPFDSWVLEMSSEVFAQVLRTGGVPIGPDVIAVSVDAGPGRQSTMRIESSARVTTLALVRVRAIFNVHGPKLFPGIFPGQRNDGQRLPQSVPSYSFTTELEADAAIDAEFGAARDLLAPGELPERGTVTIVGEGWGHGVGMSQWGAFAMAEMGATAEEILAHYYGGIAPVAAGDLLADQVSVGLTWGQKVIEFDVVGTVVLEVADRSTAVLGSGSWRAEMLDGGVVVRAVGHDSNVYPQGRLLR